MGCFSNCNCLSFPSVLLASMFSFFHSPFLSLSLCKSSKRTRWEAHQLCRRNSRTEHSPFNKEKMQQEGLGKGLFSVSNFCFVISTVLKRKLLVLFTFINICFQFPKPGKKCLSLSLTLSSHLTNVFFLLPCIKSNRHEHIFIITVWDVLEGAVVFMAVLMLSDNCAQVQPQVRPAT